MCVVMAMTLTATAQNTWEEPEKKEEKVAVVETNPMEKYLKGAVPEVNGKVTFTKTFDAPGKTAFQIYNILGKYLQGVTREPQQINSQLIKADTATYEIDVNWKSGSSSRRQPLCSTRPVSSTPSKPSVPTAKPPSPCPTSAIITMRSAPPSASAPKTGLPTVWQSTRRTPSCIATAANSANVLSTEKITFLNK